MTVKMNKIFTSKLLLNFKFRFLLQKKYIALLNRF